MPSLAPTPLRNPRAPDDLTADWMTRALRLAHPGVTVTGCVPADIVWGMAGKVRLNLRYDHAGVAAGLPATIIVKASLGAWPIEYEYMHELEAAAYWLIVPGSGVNTPRCYYAGVDTDGYSTILLEDLRTRNVTFGDISRPHDFTQAAAFLDLYARLHARYWNSADIAPGGRLSWLPAPMAEGLGIARWIDYCLDPVNWDATMLLPRATAMPRVLRDRLLMEQAITRLKALQLEAPLTVSHGDEHPRNLFVEPDGAPGVYDWQSKIVPWHLPVAYYMGSNLDIDDRRRWEQPLLAHYLGRLAAYGVSDVPGWDAAWRAYRQELLFGYFIFVNNKVEMQPETVNACIANRFGMAMLDNGTLDLLG